MTNKQFELTDSFMRECFNYVDGLLIWKERPKSHFVDAWRQKIFNSRQAGKTAGSQHDGYWSVTFSGARVGNHRIVFLLHHGFLPEEVDHIDGNPGNNKIENLRAATHSQNLKNMKHSIANTSGRKGVYLNKKTGRWRASIRVSGKLKHLGLFKEYSDAVATRAAAEKEHYGEFNRG
jgi:hypothetical protein